MKLQSEKETNKVEGEAVKVTGLKVLRRVGYGAVSLGEQFPSLLPSYSVSNSLRRTIALEL
jgi:hypothetical protein